jgi:hypothetical protein
VITTSLVDRLLQKGGRSVTFRKYARTPADPTKPWRGPQTTTASMTTVTGYAVQDQGPPGRKDRIVWGKDRTGVMNLIARTDSDLEEFDEVHDGTDVWRIEHVRAVAPGGTTYYYEVRVVR